MLRNNNQSETRSQSYSDKLLELNARLKSTIINILGQRNPSDKDLKEKNNSLEIGRTKKVTKFIEVNKQHRKMQTIESQPKVTFLKKYMS